MSNVAPHSKKRKSRNEFHVDEFSRRQAQRFEEFNRMKKTSHKEQEEEEAAAAPTSSSSSSSSHERAPGFSSSIASHARLIDKKVWGVRAVCVGTLVHLQNGIVTIGTCLPVVRKHANEGDILLVFSSTALAGNAEDRDCLLFVGLVSCKMSVAEYNGSEQGGERLDSGVHTFPHAAALVRGERKLQASEAQFSGRGGTTDYHRPLFAPHDIHAKRLVDGEFVLFFHVFKFFRRTELCDKELSRRFAPVARGCRCLSTVRDRISVNDTIMPLFASGGSGEAAAAAEAEDAPSPTHGDDTCQLSRSRHFRMKLNRAILNVILNEEDKDVCQELENKGVCSRKQCRQRHKSVCEEFKQHSSCHLGAACQKSHSLVRLSMQQRRHVNGRRRRRGNAKARKRAQKEAAEGQGEQGPAEEERPTQGGTTRA